ncbi:MAG: hypothetical protein KFB97_04895 [Cyanobium sp. M30B3]|nr:MAG: hypothetical protein KFB97_04895 [Cyanobium sp. M30B3]
MPTTLELSDPLFARLKARAASEGATLKRSAATLPRLDSPLAIGNHQLSNAGLFELASEQVLFSTVTALGLVRRVRFDRDFERFAGLQRLPLP